MKKKYYIISGVACLCALSLFCAYNYVNSIGYLVNKATNYCNSLEIKDGSIDCLCQVKTFEIFIEKDTFKKYLISKINGDDVEVKKIMYNWYRENRDSAELLVMENERCVRKEVENVVKKILEEKENGK